MERGTFTGNVRCACPIISVMEMFLHKDALAVVAEFVKTWVRQGQDGFGQGIMPSVIVLVIAIQHAGIPVCISSQNNMREAIPLTIRVGAEVDIGKAILHADGDEVSVVGEDALEATRDPGGLVIDVVVKPFELGR